MEIVPWAEGEGDKHAIWGILYLLPWCVYDFFVWQGRKYNIRDWAPKGKVVLSAR